MAQMEQTSRDSKKQKLPKHKHKHKHKKKHNQFTHFGGALEGVCGPPTFGHMYKSSYVSNQDLAFVSQTMSVPEIIYEDSDDCDNELDTEVFFVKLEGVVRGMQHYSRIVNNEEMVALERNSHNMRDPNAIRVLNAVGEQVGHIQRKIARALAPIMDNGWARVEGFVPFGAQNTLEMPIRLTLWGQPEKRNDTLLRMRQHGLRLYDINGLAMELDQSWNYDGEGTISDSMLNGTPDGRTFLSPDEVKNQIDKLFESLEEGDKTSCAEATEAIKTKMHPHQQQALSWMIKMENGDQLPPFWELRDDDTYYNTITNSNTNERPRSVHGGILADDMGLGKTLQTIALIVTNFKNNKPLAVPVPGKTRGTKSKSKVLSNATCNDNQPLINSFFKVKKKNFLNQFKSVKNVSKMLAAPDDFTSSDKDETELVDLTTLISEEDPVFVPETTDVKENIPFTEAGPLSERLSKKLVGNDFDSNNSDQDFGSPAKKVKIEKGKAPLKGKAVFKMSKRAPQLPEIDDDDKEVIPVIVVDDDDGELPDISEELSPPPTPVKVEKGKASLKGRAVFKLSNPTPQPPEIDDDHKEVVPVIVVNDDDEIPNKSGKEFSPPPTPESDEDLPPLSQIFGISVPESPMSRTPSPGSRSPTPCEMVAEIQSHHNDSPTPDRDRLHIDMVAGTEEARVCKVSRTPSPGPRSPTSSCEMVAEIQSHHKNSPTPDRDRLHIDMVAGTEETRVCKGSSKYGKATGRTECVGPRATLIVCPLSVLNTWQVQLEEHLHPCVHLNIYTYYGSGRCKQVDLLADQDIVLTTYSTLTADAKKDENPLKEVHWLRIVLDEGHSIRNPDAKQTKAIMSLKAERKWVLTGTPIQNSIKDLWSIINFLQIAPFTDRRWWHRTIQYPLLSGDESAFNRVRHLMCHVALRRTKTQKQANDKPIVELPERNVYVERVTFSEDERKVYDAMQNEGKLVISRYFRQGTLLQNYCEVLVILLRLRQLCCHPMLVAKAAAEVAKVASDAVESNAGNVDDDLRKKLIETLLTVLNSGSDAECPICLDGLNLNLPVITCCAHVYCRACIEKVINCQTPDALCPLCRANIELDTLLDVPPPQEEKEDDVCSVTEDEWQSSAKVDALMNALMLLRQEDPSIKSLVVSQFTSLLALLEVPLSSKGFKFVRFNGKMSTTRRAESIEQFSKKSEESPTIMLLSLKAGGVGISLTAASRVFLMDLAWNPASEEQCFDRCHRLGQTKDVTVIKFVVENSVEEHMLELQEKKRKLMEGAFGKKQSKEEKRQNRIQDIKVLMDL